MQSDQPQAPAPALDLEEIRREALAMKYPRWVTHVAVNSNSAVWAFQGRPGYEPSLGKWEMSGDTARWIWIGQVGRRIRPGEAALLCWPVPSHDQE